MSTPLKIIAVLIIVALLAGGAFAVYVYVSGGEGTASAPITAPTLEPAESGSETTDAAEQPTAEATASSSAVTFNIVPEQSEVRFTLSEVLRGVPTTVVGRTNQVAGQIRVDFANPSASQVGVIRINARTLTTDNDFRNRAIRSQILLSSQPEYEFAEFTPTAINGLPETITFGEPINFTITGSLTVRGITNEVTFNATVTPVSETELRGTASTTVQRAMYQLQIPNVPGVADVSEDVLLEIDFVAVPA